MDQVGTPRYSASKIDEAIRFVVSQEVDALCGEGNFKGTLASPEITSESKRILSHILVMKTINPISNNSFVNLDDAWRYTLDQVNFPLGVKKIISISVKIGDDWVELHPAAKADISTGFNGNVFDAVRDSYPYKLYFTDNNNSLDMYIGSLEFNDTGITQVKMTVIQNWIEPFSGIIVEAGDAQMEQITEMITASIKTIYKGTSYPMGSKIVIPQADYGNCLINLTYGKIAYKYTELPFPAFYYDHIARKVALTLGITTERYEKLKEIFGS